MAVVETVFGRLDLPMAEVERLRHLLSLPERARAERFRHGRDRRRFIVRRARLRQCLAAATGIAPQRLTFDTGVNGKPRLRGGGARFSLSHSGEYWLVGLAAVEIGVDIEAIDPAIDHRDTARGLFAPDEAAELELLPPGAAMRAFFDCWTRKEAFVKAIGQGLSYPLDAFRVSVGREAVLLGGGDDWTMGRLDIAPDIAGALVAVDDGAPLDITLRDFDQTAAVA